MNTNLPSIVLLVDRSGSMDKHQSLMNKHFQRWYEKFQNRTDVNFGVSLFNAVRDPIKWSHWPKIVANGGTNIYGSIMDTMTELRGQQFGAHSKVLTMVITDGEHSSNSGRNYTTTDVASEVHIAESIMGWDFLFLGTNSNAYLVGNDMGIKPGKTLSFASSNAGFEAMLTSVDGIFDRWIGGALAHDADFFSKQEREQQAELGATGRVTL